MLQEVPSHGTFGWSGSSYGYATSQKPGFANKGGKQVSVLIGILITFLVVILVLYLINMLPLDGRAKQIARVIVIIIGIVSLLKYLAVF
jgi:glucan phosphoethanolaminetransferase (alkaline phosphatase superfamily)